MANAVERLPGQLTPAEHFLGLLSDQDVDWMVATGARQTLPDGHVLIETDSEPAGLYVVLQGCLEVWGAAGEPIASLRRGELIGEVSLVDGRPASATVAVREQAIVFGVGRAQLSAKLDRDTGFAGRLYRALAAVLATRFRGLQGGPGADPRDEAPLAGNRHLVAARFERLLARMAHVSGSVVLSGNDLTVFDVARVALHGAHVDVSPLARDRIARARQVVEAVARQHVAVYGLTTGLGSLKDIRVPAEDMHAFQRNVVMSHATGIGPEFTWTEVRAIMLARLNGMCRGGSGVQPAVFQLLLDMLNAGVHPIVPSRGSIGMSDLAPLAHLALPLIGLGEVEYRDERLPGLEGLARAGLAPVRLGLKDGLALCSANSASVGQGALVLDRTLELLACADLAAALSLEAFQGSASYLDERTHAARPYTGELTTAHRMRRLLAGSSLWNQDRVRRVQDPLSLRCIPQVHGACQDALAFVRGTMEIELNGTGDNPVVLIDENAVVSNGNFHSAGLAIAFDTLSIVLGQWSGLATSRVLRLLDPHLTGLPPALVRRPGVNTGFNVLQKTLTALNAENRFLAGPASLDFQPVAGEIEDHATNAALCVRKAAEIVENCQRVLAIEVLVAAQAVSLRDDLTLGHGTRVAFELVREVAPYVDQDRVMAPLLTGVVELVSSGRLLRVVSQRSGVDLTATPPVTEVKPT
jgi:histidine ammonia-lyase